MFTAATSLLFAVVLVLVSRNSGRNSIIPLNSRMDSLCYVYCILIVDFVLSFFFGGFFFFFFGGGVDYANSRLLFS
jgi:hypothetical protein